MSFQNLFQSRLLQNSEQISPCCTAGPCYLSIWYIVVVFNVNPNLLIYPLSRFPFGNHQFGFKIWVRFVKKFFCIFFFFLLDSTY